MEEEKTKIEGKKIMRKNYKISNQWREKKKWKKRKNHKRGKK
jgi:hypothetical protein